MITRLRQVRRWVNIINPGGMGTNVPQVSQELRKLGYEVLIDQPGRDFDILDIHIPLFSSFLLAYKTRGKKPLVIHARHIPELVKGGIIFGDLLYRPLRWYSKYFYDLADVVICPTPYVKKLLIKEGIESRLEIVPNGVDRNVFRSSEEGRRRFRKKYGFPEDDFIVLSVGLNIPRKGVKTFLAVAKAFEKKKNVKFLWVGSSEPFLHRVNIDHIPRNAFFLGHLPFTQIPDAYSGSDLFLFPSYAEGYGNALFEAASSGKALIVRNIPAWEGLFVHDRNCLKGTSVDDFVSYVSTLHNDDRSKSDLERGSLEIAREHDIGRCAVELARVYDGLCS